MAEQKKGFFGTPFILLSFVLVFFILFDFPKGIRAGTARVAGLIFGPLIGFHGKYPLLTIFLASVVLVVATTAIRHFLVDWTKAARVQEAMRAYTNEMREARKSNNTYKLKKLTDAQADVMTLQTEVQADQMKPMAFTMLLVIPIFAWLGGYVNEPAHFEATDVPDATYAIVGLDTWQTTRVGVVGPGGGALTTDRDLSAYAIKLAGTGSTSFVHFAADKKEFTLPTGGAPSLPAESKLADLAAGTYTFSYAPSDAALTVAGEGNNVSVKRVLLLVQEGNVWTSFVAGTDNGTLTTNGGALFVVVPSSFADASASGLGVLKVQDRSYTVGPTHLLKVPPTSEARVHPHESKVPWNHHWSYQDNAVLIRWHTPFAHWIALYSLFGIPFGQIAQRALKLWEYRHVDLDADGIPAGQNP
ncbi:MAG TPA: EMC3/TMCO1 family protein [Candidatus Thermoplasmatota archaeon]|nr:EMC3/TMCO1 family protein [Candidatus Thermoplasmatota archaeon]